MYAIQPGRGYEQAAVLALTCSIFLSLTVTAGSLAHMVPMLIDRGISVNAAVAAMSISGMAMTIGRLISGYLMDKIFAIYVAIFFLAIPMIGLGLLISCTAGSWPIVAVVFKGLLIGAEFDLMAFIVNRYFGIRAFRGVVRVYADVCRASERRRDATDGLVPPTEAFLGSHAVHL